MEDARDTWRPWPCRLSAALVAVIGLVAAGACSTGRPPEGGLEGAAVGGQPTPTPGDVRMSEGRGSPMGGSVWRDEDQDGSFGQQELPAGGLEVRLWRDSNGDGVCRDGDELAASATTDPSGEYSLVAPVAGDYCIEVLDPSGVRATLVGPQPLQGGQPAGWGIGLD